MLKIKNLLFIFILCPFFSQVGITQDLETLEMIEVATQYNEKWEEAFPELESVNQEFLQKILIPGYEGGLFSSVFGTTAVVAQYKRMKKYIRESESILVKLSPEYKEISDKLEFIQKEIQMSHKYNFDITYQDWFKSKIHELESAFFEKEKLQKKLFYFMDVAKNPSTVAVSNETFDRWALLRKKMKKARIYLPLFIGLTTYGVLDSGVRSYISIVKERNPGAFPLLKNGALAISYGMQLLQIEMGLE